MIFYFNNTGENSAPEPWVVLPATSDDRQMFYRNNVEGNLTVGCLRGDFGKGGDEFHHSWFESGSGQNTPEFKAELQVIINGLRKDLLRDLKSSQEFCYRYPQAQLPGDIHRYGFKVETRSYKYFVRCTVIPNDYFYVFAYKNHALSQC